MSATDWVVPEYGQKLTALGGTRVAGNFRGGSCSSSHQCGTWLFLPRLSEWVGFGETDKSSPMSKTRF